MAFELHEDVRVLVVSYDEHKRSQASFFDEGVDAEYEINRPRGTPNFHRWLLNEKFRRSIEKISDDLQGASVLTICGGSGLDAEFIATSGASVLCTDISIGAAKRAATRAARFGVQYEVAVADAEALPFPDRSFDFVYVHDGLHHLEQPIRGVAEMARVARQGICITEPARAAMTRISVLAGVSTDAEDAGNAVRRLREGDVRDALEAAGFSAKLARRYLMYYRHEPGLATRVLSPRYASAAGRAAFRLANALGGRVGNKLTIQAVRR